jgi:hypothetical protein
MNAASICLLKKPRIEQWSLETIDRELRFDNRQSLWMRQQINGRLLITFERLRNKLLQIYCEQ